MPHILTQDLNYDGKCTETEIWPILMSTNIFSVPGSSMIFFGYMKKVNLEASLPTPSTSIFSPVGSEGRRFALAPWPAWAGAWAGSLIAL